MYVCTEKVKCGILLFVCIYGAEDIDFSYWLALVTVGYSNNLIDFHV